MPPAAAAAAAKSLQSCPTLRPHRQQPTRLPHPWDSPGKNTGVGCHFLLQCMKVKSESEVSQSCLTLSDPMDCSPPGSSFHGIFQARVLEWGAIAFSYMNIVHLKLMKQYWYTIIKYNSMRFYSNVLHFHLISFFPSRISFRTSNHIYLSCLLRLLMAVAISQILFFPNTLIVN